MAKYLVIVESPAKVKTIKKFLGANYEVMASNGHVRDLPKSQLGIDVEHDYEPKYITIRGKGDVLAALRKEVKKADKIYLATDPDREGEAISWHLYAALKLEDKKVYRITFNEITKNAVKESLKNPREIDMDLVDAQQARRMLDRMVGYRISPLLWAKVKRGLSAGRVQSVALRLIGDREDEINAFIPEEYWNLEAKFRIPGEKKPLTAKFYGTKDEKLAITNKDEMDSLLKELEGARFLVADVKKGERVRKQPLPFTTSTLQQEASKALNFSTQKTMRLAQQLYEGVEIKGQGTVGLISYLRTDSTRISDEAAAAAADFVKEHYGNDFLLKQSNTKNSKGKIQDAHEAIRPTDINRVPSDLKEALPRDLFRLYQLIWRRFFIFLCHISSGKNSRNGRGIGRWPPNAHFFQCAHKTGLRIMSRRLGKMLAVIKILKGKLRILVNRLDQGIGFRFFLVSIRIYAHKALKLQFAGGNMETVSVPFYFDGSSGIDCRRHPACGKASPDQLVKTE